jgi:large subunit ribosomal protein L17
MQRNLAQSLFEHGQVRTTLAKAKDIRPFAEGLITLAKKAKEGSKPARRRIHKLLGDRSLVPAEHQESYDLMSDARRASALRFRSGRRHRTGQPRGRLAFTAESVAYRLINTVAPQFADRDGGYTRIIRLADRRVGDHGPLAVVQLVGQEESPGPVAKPSKTARQRRADARYAAAVKASRAGGPAKKGEARPEASEPEAPEPPATDGAEPEEEGEAEKQDA